MDKVDRFRKQSDDLKGKRIECNHMKDENPVPSGTLGTISFVDDMGTIHVKWDNGSGLGLVQDVDTYTIK